MEQLCAALEASALSVAKTPANNSVNVKSGVGVASDALLLALRGLSLSGGNVGAEEASRFKKVSVANVGVSGSPQVRQEHGKYLAR